MYLQLNHLRSLLALVETGSLTAAAQQLHLTQSALSHQIKGLEDYFGTRLFQRKSRPLKLSVAGDKLLALARVVVPQVEDCEYSLTRMAAGVAGRLHIGIECHSCFQWLMPTLDRYREYWPEVELDLTLGHSFAPLPALKSGRVDLVISSDWQPDPALAFVPLFRYESWLAVSADHPLVDRERLFPEDLQTETLITYPVEQGRLDVFSLFLHPAGVQPAAVRHVELTPMIMQLVASNRGVSAFPSWVYHEYLHDLPVHTLPMGEKGVWATLYAVLRKEDVQAAYMQGFLERAKATCFDSLPGIVSVE